MTPATATLDALNLDRQDSNIFERAVCLSLELRRLGTKRKMSVSELQPGVPTDLDLIHASKDLLTSPELDAIKQHDGAIRRWLEGKVSGPALFRTGVYMLSIDLVGPVDAELCERLTERSEKLIPAFVAVYEASVAEARRRLGAHFRAEEYPDPSAVAGAFSAQVRYFTLGSPAGLERIAGDIFEREQAKAAEQWAEVLEASRAVLRGELSELVGAMVDRLTPGADGKTRRFAASTVENLDQFFELFSARNIANDGELQTIVQQARAAMAGVNVKDLRESRLVRNATRERFAEVRASIERLNVTAGARSYNLED